jgi:hypothetical protein
MSSLPRVRDVRAEFIESFGKDIPLYPDIKELFIEMRKGSRYADEQDEGSTSKFLPVQMVNDVIERQDLAEIVRLLSHARGLQNALFEGGIDLIEDINDFLAMETNYDAIQAQRNQFERNKKKYQAHKYYETAHMTHPEFPYRSSGARFFNFNENGRHVPSKTITVMGPNGLNVIRNTPEYEFLGPTGYYNSNVNELFRDESFYKIINYLQKKFNTFRKAKDIRVFHKDLYTINKNNPDGSVTTIKLISDEAIDALQYLKNTYDYITVQIRKLERAKNQYMQDSVRMGRVEEFDKLISMRQRNLQHIIDKYDLPVSRNQLNVDTIAALIQNSPNNANLRAYIQPSGIPKIRDNIMKLTTLRANAATRRGGRRHKLNKTKRK